MRPSPSEPGAAAGVTAVLDEIGIGEPVRSELVGTCDLCLVKGWAEWWASPESEGKGTGWVVTQLRAGVGAPAGRSMDERSRLIAAARRNGVRT